MDEFLAAVGVQAMKYAIRSGITLTSSYALSQCSRLLKSVGDEGQCQELRRLQKLLDGKIRVITPAIDLVELKSGRGNVFLESAVPLTRSLHQEIVALGRRIEAIALVEEELPRQSKSQTSSQHPSRHRELDAVIVAIKHLLQRIDREAPLLQLAITASGESFSTTLPTSISPSRLLQASTLLIVGDTQYAQNPFTTVQIGPSFTLSLYMLFLGHSSGPSQAHSHHLHVHAASSGGSPPRSNAMPYGLRDSDRKPMWQEVMHKARVRLCRAPQDPIGTGLEVDFMADCTHETPGFREYSYHLEIVEDLDDGRVHDDAMETRRYDGMTCAGDRRIIPLHQIAKLFYADTGKILNIDTDAVESENNPVLLLKRDIHASRGSSPGDVVDQYAEGDGSLGQYDGTEQFEINQQLQAESSESSNPPHLHKTSSSAESFPQHLDPEWIALEVFEEDTVSFSDSETEDDAGLLVDANDKSDRPKSAAARGRISLDSGLVGQLRSLSIHPRSTSDVPQSSSLHPRHEHRSRGSEAEEAADTQEFVARSPFSAITSSLSLIEMLIRLARLQEYQQASHLSIPDHILTFFLEEASTTGLMGDAQRRARREAEQRVGFDPYTDTPTS